MAGKLIRPYLKHDEDSQMDRSVAKIIHKYDYLGYGLFWSVIEYLHKNKTLFVGEEYLIRGYDKHSDIVNAILNDFDLFRIEDDCYVSDRILSDLEASDKKREQAKDAVETKWLMSGFKKAYEDVFETTPIISSEEVENLKKYNAKIKDFKKVLPDIVYTLKFIQFDDKIKRKPLCNWLLQDNNLLKVYNGEYGKLRHKKTTSELKAEQKKAEEERIEANRSEEEYFAAMARISTKENAIEYILANNSDLRFINPLHGTLIERFRITSKDLKEYKAQ